MKILLDECVDWRLSRDILNQDVKTARQMGWSAIQNGELLALAVQSGFDVFVTVDPNLSYQQNLAGISISVIVLQAPTNRLADLQKLVPNLLAALYTVVPGKPLIVSEP